MVQVNNIILSVKKMCQMINKDEVETPVKLRKKESNT